MEPASPLPEGPSSGHAVVSPNEQDLGHRSLSAVFWGSLGAVLRLGLQVGAQIVLARLLGPEQYGIFAIGATVVSFSAFFSDIGLAYGLIQKSTVVDRDVRFVFTWQVALGVIVTTTVAASAPIIASFFSEPRATDIIRALSVLCMLNALTAPSLNLLKRRLDFRTIQFAQLAAYTIGYVVIGIPLALAGAQVWALVAAWIVQGTVNGVWLYRSVRHPLTPLAWYEDAAAQARYSGAVLATNLVNWSISNIDRVVVGRAFGSRDIGLYATVYNLFYNPAATFLSVVQPVFFSASSRIAADPARVGASYCALVSALTIVVLPVFTAVAIAAETVILTLYGPAWRDAAEIARPLALVMPMFLLFGITTPLLWTSGRPTREFRVQAPVAVLWLALCWIAATHSAAAVAWTVMALYTLRCGIITTVACRMVGLKSSDYWRSTRGGLVVTAGTATAVAAVEVFASSWSPALRLSTVALCGVACWLGLLHVWPGLISAEFATLSARIFTRLPAGLSRRLVFLVPNNVRR